MCSPNPNLFSWCITPPNSVLIHFKKLVIPSYGFLSSSCICKYRPIWSNTNRSHHHFQYISDLMVFNSPLFGVTVLVIHFTSCENDPITNPFAIANFWDDFLFAMFGCMPLKQQEHVNPFEVFSDHGDSNKTFKSTSLMMY
jgi:hypothetical protein